jgi:hypothetical protein
VAERRTITCRPSASSPPVSFWERGLAVLFAPEVPVSEIREAIGEKISNLRPAAEA